MRVDNGIYIYELAPIDFGWSILPTLKGYYKMLIDEYTVLEDAEKQISITKEFAEKCFKHARNNGWEGDFRMEPRVFILPSDGTTVPALMWKQDNNGTTFVAAPFSLPWLKPLAF